MDSITRIQSTQQATSVTGTATSASGASVAPRTVALLAAGDVLTSVSSSAGGATLGNLLPSTMEQAVSSATDNTQQATLMGQTVGASLAETGDSINWRDFSTQAKSSLSAAGYSDAEIKVYLGAVKQTYQQFAALPVSTAAAASTATSALSTSTAAPDDYDPDNYDPDSNNYDPTTGGSTSTQAATSTSALIIDPSQLPNTDLPASTFAALAQQAYVNAWTAAGSSVDIDDLVANTQTEMDNMGYSQDQVDNYMVGLFQGYNVVNQTATPAANHHHARHIDRRYRCAHHARLQSGARVRPPPQQRRRGLLMIGPRPTTRAVTWLVCHHHETLRPRRHPAERRNRRARHP